MPTIEELKSRFIVSDDVIKTRLEGLIERALKHCVVDQSGAVHIRNTKLSTKERIKLVMSARLLASKLSETIPAGVTGAQLAEYVGIPKNQAQARVKELIDGEKFAESKAGLYIASAYKVQLFLENLEDVQQEEAVR